jgi:hypothetical protein
MLTSPKYHWLHRFCRRLLVTTKSATFCYHPISSIYRDRIFILFYHTLVIRSECDRKWVRDDRVINLSLFKTYMRIPIAHISQILPVTQKWICHCTHPRRHVRTVKVKLHSFLKFALCILQCSTWHYGRSIYWQITPLTPRSTLNFQINIHFLHLRGFEARTVHPILSCPLRTTLKKENFIFRW